MIRRAVFSLGLLVGSIAVANAADIGPAVVPVAITPVVVPPAPFSWTGAYVGATAGWDGEDFCGPAPCEVTPPVGYPHAFLLGAYAGYNLQFGPHMVAGLDVLIGTVLPRGFTNVNNVQTNNFTPFRAMVRVRGGFALGQVLLYGTAGLSVLSHNCPACGGVSTRPGWTVGGGAELALGSAWSMRVDYAFSHIDGFSWPLPFQANNVTHTLTIGLAYAFGR